MPNVKYKTSTNDVSVASNGTSAVTLYTFGTGLVNPDGSAGYGGIVEAVNFVNRDTVQHGYRLHLIPDGDALGDDTIIDQGILAAGEAYRYLGPERSKDSGVLQLVLTEAHTTNPVYAKPSLTEITA